MSSNTVRVYISDIEGFFRYIKYRYKLYDENLNITLDDLSSITVNDIDLDLVKKINIQDIISYISYLDKYMDNSSATRSRKISSLRSFFEYLHVVIKVIDIDPMSTIRGPKLSKRLPIHLDIESVKKLLEAILETENIFYRKRDYAIIITFLNTGVRLSELTNIDLEHINKDASLNIIGKGNKERKIYLNDTTIDAINDYLSVRPNIEESALFLSNRNTRISNRAIQHMLDKYLKIAGLADKGFSPHKLRHTAATLLYQYGNIDIRTLQVLLGHENVSTTQIYTHVSDEQLRAAVNLNPLQNIELKDS
ncbi:MAG: tyrosine recombinase XerC [Tissierellia bacterium]|nr:tyrosine recombinase XerC [Tissierellia bacterium]